LREKKMLEGEKEERVNETNGKAGEWRENYDKRERWCFPPDKWGKNRPRKIFIVHRPMPMKSREG